MNESREETIQALVAENRAYQAAVDMVDEAAHERLGLSRTDGRCLDVLEQEAPVTAGRLAAAAGLTPGAVTGVIDRLERAGLARRTRDKGDRRRVLVDATPRARKLSAEAYGALAEEGYARLASYTTEELRTILRFLRDARELNERQAARLRD